MNEFNKKDFEQLTTQYVEARIKKLGLKTTFCKTCGTEIMFLETKNGKIMPVTLGMLSHFADCAQAAQHRKTQ